MSVLDGSGVPIIGAGVQVEIDELVTVPLAFLDLLDGKVVPGDSDHHLRIIMPAQRRALLIPVNRRLLATLHTRIAQAIASDEHSTPEGETHHG